MTEDMYIIYEVRYKGIPVYIGSGLPDRYLHVKSGKSHNAELNKLFFTDPDNIVVQILREGLVKKKALKLNKNILRLTSLSII